MAEVPLLNKTSMKHKPKTRPTQAIIHRRLRMKRQETVPVPTFTV